MKVGDKVWVLCDVEEVHPEGEVLVSGLHGGEFYVSQSDCRPVEPLAVEACTKTANDQLRQSLMDYPFGEPPVIKDSLTTESNCPEIPDSSSDPINPSHYKHLPAEAIDIIEAAIAKAPSNQYAFLHGQVIKYLLRCWSKKGIEDLRKAKWYLDRLVGEAGE